MRADESMILGQLDEETLFKFAVSGHPDAQYAWGYLVHEGLCQRPDPREAFRWFMRAAQQGHPKALKMVVQMLWLDLVPDPDSLQDCVARQGSSWLQRLRQAVVSRRGFFKLMALGLLAGMNSACEEPDTEVELKSPWPVLPYVQNVTTTGITVLWESPGPAQGVVEIYENSNFINEYKDQEGLFHKIQITGLAPNTTYFYQAKDDQNNIGEPRSFKTAPNELDSSVPFSFVAMGCGGIGKRHQYKIADQILAKANPNFIIHCGDVVYDGYEGDYFEKFFVPYRSLIRNIPMFPIQGDHDLVSDSDPFFKFFSLPTNPIEGTSDFYYFTYGHALFIALNSNRWIGGDNATQKQFLNELLDESTHTWKFIYVHHPLYTSALRHGPKPILRDDIGSVAEEHEVAMVFNADNHVYERFEPVREFYPENRGVVYVTTGGAGADLYEMGTTTNSIGYSSYNFVHVSIDGNNLTMITYDDNGGVLDTYSMTAS